MGSSQLESFFTGTLGLTAVFLVAAWLAFSRSRVTGDPRRLRRLQLVAALAIGAQALHFVEELCTGFYLRFPPQLGLKSWPMAMFVVFNTVWIAVWAIATLAIRTRATIVLLLLWFLALGLLLNGIAHPLLAIRVSGYFPGLFTSPLVAILGGALLFELGRATSNIRRT